MPTHADIARAAEVSKTTVSFALRNDPKISKKTRDRVHKVADELGYRPNPLVAAHMAQIRSSKDLGYRSTLAFISNAPVSKIQDNIPTFKKKTALNLFAKGAVKRARNTGHQMDIFHFDETNIKLSRLDQILRSRGIRGIVIPPFPISETNLLHDWQNFACSCIGFFHIQKLPFHRAHFDSLHAIQTVTHKLSNAGYKRVGLFLTEEDDYRNHYSFTSGYLRYQNTIPKSRRLPLLVVKKNSHEAFMAWYEKNRPDAIIGMRDDAPSILKLHGRKIPQEVAYANLVCMDHQKSYAGCEQPFEALGAAAVDLVTAQLYRNECGYPSLPKHVLIPGQWQNGLSCPLPKLK